MPARYRLADLGPINAVPPGQDNSFGLNNKGQAVWVAFISPAWTARVWLPAADYSMSAGGYDLPLPSGFCGDAAANDINEDGLIAGVAGGMGASDLSGEAVVWALGSTIAVTRLGILEDGDWSAAYALNNATNPVVVGASDRGVDYCAPEYELPAQVQSPFRLLFSSSPTMHEIPPAMGHSRSAAYDVDNVLDDLEPNWPGIVGTHQVFDPDPCQQLALDECDPSNRRARKWTDAGAAGLAAVDDEDDGEYRARGMNDAQHAVGHGFRNDPGCLEQPFFWYTVGTSAGSYVNLAAQAGPSGHNTRAEAISNPDGGGLVQIVGKDVDDDVAYLWTGQPDGSTPAWQAENLNPLIGSDCASRWILRVADDVNDIGHIIGHGQRTIGTSPAVTTTRAYVLIPITTCLQDLTGDGIVNGMDIAIVLGSFGACPVPGQCLPDLNCDGTVNGLDTAIVLGAWGNCPGSESMSSPSQTGCEGTLLEELVAALNEHGLYSLAETLQSLCGSQ